MGTQNQGHGPNDPQRKPGSDPQQKPQPGGERFASDDDAGGEMDADAEVSQPGEQSEQDRERSGASRPRNS